MRVDDVNRSLSVEPRHLCQQASIEPPPCTREAQISGNLRIPHPIRRRRSVRFPPTMVDRGYCNGARDDPKLLKHTDRLRDEATAHFIAGRREKWRQR